MWELSKKAKRRRMIVAAVEQGIGAIGMVAGLFIVCGAAGLLCRLLGVQV